jgi:methylated-DNA-[protein]-cysteine S-methyltransferase
VAAAADEAGLTSSFDATLAAPFATLGVATDGAVVTRVAYLRSAGPAIAPRSRLAARTLRELERWLDDPAFRFTVPLAPAATPFQQRVRDAVRAIPLGESRTYAEVARAVRSSARAVGNACGANAIALVVPCHRVVGSRGALGGFMHGERADAVAVKRWLLVHEGYRFGR